MALLDFTNQKPKDTFQYLMQISSSTVGTGVGTQVQNVELTSSWATTAVTAKSASIATLANTAAAVRVYDNAPHSYFGINAGSTGVEISYNYNDGASGEILIRASTSSIALAPDVTLTDVADSILYADAFGVIQALPGAYTIPATASWALQTFAITQSITSLSSASWASESISSSYPMYVAAGELRGRVPGLEMSSYVIADDYVQSPEIIASTRFRNSGVNWNAGSSLLNTTAKVISQSQVSIANGTDLNTVGTITASAFVGSLIGDSTGTSSWATIAIIADSATTASFASSSISSSHIQSLLVQPVTASWATNVVNAPTVTHVATASWASASLFSSTSSQSLFATSASWASSSLSSSLTTFLRGTATGSVATGVSFWGTASWAVNVVNGTVGPTVPTSVTQSSFDIPLKEMQMTETGGVTSLIATSINDYVDPETLMASKRLLFSDDNGAWSKDPIASYTGRVPLGFGGGLTHSFQYFPIGIFDNDPTSKNVYWNIALFAIPSSTAITSNFHSAVLVERKNVTQSFAGSPHHSGSIITVTSMFNDPNKYLLTSSMMILNVFRINDTNTAPSESGGDGTNYTASVAVISSRLRWNVA